MGKRTDKDFVPTQLGSADTANVAGRPTDAEVMVVDNPDPANAKMSKEDRVKRPLTRS